MKRWSICITTLSIISSFLINNLCAQDGAGIFISEYFEGKSDNKAIEIYNGNNAGTTLNLNRIRVRLYSNGDSTASRTLLLGTAEDGFTTTIAWDSTFVIYNSAFAVPVDTYLPNVPTARRISNASVINYNGNDALEVQFDSDGFGNWITVDIFGKIGENPGIAWKVNNISTIDRSLERKSSINTGVAVNPSTFDPSAEYDDNGNITLPITTLGQHTVGSPLPVQLAVFSASVQWTDVTLNWQTATETNCYGFDVERRSISNPYWSAIYFVHGAGYSAAPRKYGYVDVRVAPGRFLYRLKQIDQNSKFQYYGPIEVEVFSDHQTFTLYNYPNPFNPKTTVGFSVPADGYVRLKVYSILGQEVTTLFQGIVQGGKFHTVPYDGTSLASGMYLYSLEYGGRILIKRMLMMK